MKSVFSERNHVPSEADLKKALGKTYILWISLYTHVLKIFPSATAAWHYSGDQSGWSFRVSDVKRVLIYLLPREGFFKAAFVFGKKAADKIFESKLNDQIRQELMDAKVYAEGRGIRIDVKNKGIVADIKKLISIKINN